MRILVVFALDVPGETRALDLAKELSPAVTTFRHMLKLLGRVTLLGVRGVTKPVTTELEAEVVRCLTR